MSASGRLGKGHLILPCTGGLGGAALAGCGGPWVPSAGRTQLVPALLEGASRSGSARAAIWAVPHTHRALPHLGRGTASDTDAPQLRTGHLCSPPGRSPRKGLLTPSPPAYSSWTPAESRWLLSDQFLSDPKSPCNSLTPSSRLHSDSGVPAEWLTPHLSLDG